MPRTMTHREPRYAPLKIAATYAGVPVRTLRDWGAKGLIPLYRIGPRQIQVDLNDLDRMRRRIPAGYTSAPSGSAAVVAYAGS